jgi:hypothetical protein
MLPFGVTIPATVPQGSEIPKGLMNNPVYFKQIHSLETLFLYKTVLEDIPTPMCGIQLKM